MNQVSILNCKTMKILHRTRIYQMDSEMIYETVRAGHLLPVLNRSKISLQRQSFHLKPD